MEIIEFELNNGIISAGVIVDTAVTNNLAIGHGPSGENTFLVNYGQLLTYRTPAGWDTIATTTQTLNLGAYAGDIYANNFAYTKMFHFDGSTDFDLICDFAPPYFSTLDVAVDVLGNAWVATGDFIGQFDHLRVFDRNGAFVQSYQMVSQSFSSAFGSFILEDELYIADHGTNEDWLHHINISGGQAYVDQSYPFPQGYVFGDLASCLAGNPGNFVATTISERQVPSFDIYPNPVNDILNIQVDELETRSDITLRIRDVSGRLVLAERLSGVLSRIDVSRFQPGMYLMEIGEADRKVQAKFIRE